MSEIQEEIFKKIKDSICSNVECYPVRHSALAVATPFLDWMGERVEVFITENGEITDGEQTLNQIKALNSYNDFIKWSNQKDYFINYNINLIGESLDIHYLENPQSILRYIQGIARLPGFFEARPLGEKQDRFPTLVKNMVRDALVSNCPLRPIEGMVDWALRLTQPKTIKINSVQIYSDMSPVDGNKIVEIISHQNSNDSTKNAHVREKLFNPIFLKAERQDVEPFTITYDLQDYPRESQDLLRSETTVFEIKNPNAMAQITKMLVEGQTA